MSPFARRRIAALLLLAALFLAVLALIGEGPFDDTPPPSEAHVAAKVEDLYGAAASGEFGRFCALLTDRARSTLQRNAARLTGDEDLGCARALNLTLGDVLEGATVEVEEASVSGPRARVVARFRAPGEEPELRTVYLEDIDGEWLVTDPG